MRSMDVLVKPGPNVKGMVTRKGLFMSRIIFQAASLVGLVKFFLIWCGFKGIAQKSLTLSQQHDSDESR
jgi:hypothetical protein